MVRVIITAEATWLNNCFLNNLLYCLTLLPCRRCFGEPTYKAAWARAEAFDEIIVSPKMITDHLPDVVIRALEQLADQNYIPSQLVEIRSPSATS